MRNSARGILMCLMLVVVLSAPLSAAVSVDDQLQAIRSTVASQQQEINTLKTSSGMATGNQSAMEAQRDMVASMVKAETSKLTQNWGWVSTWTFDGDFHYRHEWINAGNAFESTALWPNGIVRNINQRARTHQQIRLRLNGAAQVNDEMKVKFRIAAGNGAATTNELTLGDWFASDVVWLDRAYLEYMPKCVPGLSIVAGKFGVPFYKVGNNEMIFDNDLSPEGIAAIYELKVSDGLKLVFSGGGFWLSEGVNNGVAAINFDSYPDEQLWGFQGYANVALPMITDGAYIIGGLSYYDAVHLKHNLQSATPGGLGNSAIFDPSTGVTTYLSDFNILNPFVEFGMPVMDLPLSIFADFAINTSTQEYNEVFSTVIGGETYAQHYGEQGLGWLIGAQLGKADKPGTWEVEWDYRDVAPDAVVGALCDSNSFGGGTDGKGHHVRLAYAPMENVVLAANWYCQHTNAHFNALDSQSGVFGWISDEEFFNMFQFDVCVKF